MTTSDKKTSSTQTSDAPARCFCVIGENRQKLWSLSQADRFARQFNRAGIATQITEHETPKTGAKVVVVRADSVIDQPLIQALCGETDFLLKASDGNTIIAASVDGAAFPSVVAMFKDGAPHLSSLPVYTPDQLKAHFWQALRKREVPYALVLDAESKSDIEWRMFMGTYKGATDIVTKHLWPRPAFHVTRYLAERGVTPNMVTTVGAAATVAAFFLFLHGNYVLGLFAAWLMTFLDTVDGKLARTTLTSSKWGDIFDHGIDLVHPPFWYAAWALGLSAVGIVWPSEVTWGTIGIILAGYVLQRIFEGIAIKWLGLEIHIWRPIDTLFRQITARRNPNLMLLTIFTALGRPDWGLLAVAVWTVLCLFLHAIQLWQALVEKRRRGGGPLQSWMTAP